MPVQAAGNDRAQKRSDTEPETAAQHMQGDDAASLLIFKPVGERRNRRRVIETGQNAHDDEDRDQGGVRSSKYNRCPADTNTGQTKRNRFPRTEFVA